MAIVFGTDYVGLNEILKPEREAGKRIVMCSGTFDLLHVGHMRMLNTAKSKGDILIVAVKSDEAAALKKENPPVMNQNIRMETVANCVSSDYVILAEYDIRRKVPCSFENTSSFEWLTMFYPIISTIKPDCFVHEDNQVIAKSRYELFTMYNVEGIIHPRTEGVSTTDIIDKIKTRLLLELQKEKE